MKKRFILLVEDNPDDIELTRLALQESAITAGLAIAQNGQEALDFLFATGAHAGRDLSRPPALVLLDLNLPRVTGLDVLRAMRADERTRFVPVVVLTSSLEDEDLVESYRLGANSYIRKPIDFEAFQAAARQLGTYWLLLNQPFPRQGHLR
jgi:two-component system response regulator